MSSHRILQSLVLSCACLLCASAIAAPVEYALSGYFATRSTEAAQILPAFSMGPEGFTGSVRFDTEVVAFDSDWAEQAVFPVRGFHIADASGHVIADGGGIGRRLLTISVPDFPETLSFVAVTDIGTGASQSIVELHFIWRAPVRGQLPAGQPGQQIPPEDFRSLNLAQLDPSGWQLTVLAFPGACYPECAAADTLHGQLGPFVPLASWDRSASDFANGAPGWQPKSGTWVADNGQYRNTSNQQAAISVLGTAAAPDYRIDARVRLQWSASGNRGGLVYDYLNANNYRAVLIASRNTPSTAAWLQVIEVIGGVRRVVAQYADRTLEAPWAPAAEGRVSVSRIDGVTSISTNGMVRPVVIAQSDVPQPSVGVIASWNLVRFDDFVLGQRRPSALQTTSQ